MTPDDAAAARPDPGSAERGDALDAPPSDDDSAARSTAPAEPTASSGSTTPSPPPPEEPSFLTRLPWWAVPAILVGVPLLFAVAVQVEPDLYDDVVWTYYWGPIKSDADNDATRCFDGSRDIGDDEAGYRACVDEGGAVASSGYNVVNTLTWAVLLGVCILGLAQMLATFRTTMDDRLIVAATAWVVVGSVAHVLEDVGLFTGPLQFFFITPPIYLLFAAFGVGAFLVGQWMRSTAVKADLHAALRVLWLVHIVLVVVYLGLWWKDWPGIVRYINPVWVAIFAVVDFLVARAVVLRMGRVDPSIMTLVLSTGTYLLVGAYVIEYLRDPWSDFGGGGMPSAFLVAPLLAAIVTGLVFLLARRAPKALLGIVWIGGSILGGIAAFALLHTLASRLGERFGIGALSDLADTLEGHALGAMVVLAFAVAIAIRAWQKHRGQGPVLVPLVAAAYALGINLLLVFSQVLDGFGTALGLDLHSYTEKHVLSGQVIDVMRDVSTSAGWGFGAEYPTFLAFVPVKLLISLLVVYAIDVHSREDSARHPTMIGLVKFAIIMVGIGPGVRNFVRLSLGV